MKTKQLSPILLLTSSVWLVCAMSATAQQVTNSQTQSQSIASVLRQSRKIREIPQLSQIEHPSTSAQMLAQSPAPTNPPEQQAVIEVTGVQANPTEKGVEVILQTTQGEQLQITNRSAENNFIADIPNAQLRLASGDGFTFSSQNPVDGISEITVINLDANTIRVTVAGETRLPTVELFDSDEGLIFGFTPAATAMQPETEQPTSEIPQEEPSAQGDEPIELIVTGQQDNYRVPDATSATRTDTPLRDIPASIQVVPRQVIEDRGITNVAEALQNVSGTNSEIYGGNYASPRLRGFASFDSFFRNGTSLGGFAYDNSNTDNIEQIEVLKGPASVLFGQGSPGGIINLVTKKPLSEPYYNLGFSVGSFEQYRPSFDISGPLNPEKTVLYRFVGSYNRARSFVEFANSERYFLAPSLEWRISPDTKLALDLEFIDSSATFICGVPAVGRGVADIPRSRALCESGDFGDPFGKDDLQRYNLSATFDHRFSQDWSVRNTFAARSSNLRRAQGGYSNFDEATGEFSSRSFFTSDDSVSSYFNNLDITGNLQTGSIEHKLLFGFEFGRETRNRRIFFDGFDLDTPFNIFNPVYSTERFRFDSFPFGTQRDENFTTYAFYLQDQIAFTDNLKLLLGGRFDSFQRKIDNLITSTTTERTTSVFSPRVGLVYQPIQPVSLYASFVQGFQPNTANLADGSAPPPQKATQYEVGVKADLSDRVSATLAYFDITKTNIPTTDPANRSFSVVTGEVKSRGVELDISGEISPGWNMIAAYAYTDAFVSQDNRIPVGNRFVFTPRHSFSLWNTYQIQQGTLEGLGFGLGLYYVGEREADLVNSFAVPSYLRTDASIFYRRDNWRAQINFQNVFNTEYFVGTNEFREGGVMPGAPFSVVGSVSITF
ncbi:TonB-dependent siderophore receptor [Nodularia chucula]|uniref:TonB-dependent siderophore receptor n=1 Tax=Nodularia chucula TaxID=3093667 RepID=UPI0039C63AA3